LIEPKTAKHSKFISLDRPFQDKELAVERVAEKGENGDGVHLKAQTKVKRSMSIVVPGTHEMRSNQKSKNLDAYED
jgi:hypothetical protein